MLLKAVWPNPDALAALTIAIFIVSIKIAQIVAQWMDPFCNKIGFTGHQ